jgi:hypothetical protein
LITIGLWVINYIVAMTTPIELNKTYTFAIENFSFDVLTREELIKRYKDGRPFSHFIEPWLTTKFPLKHIEGCKSYDHVDNDQLKYDEKTFTALGCKLPPSGMIGGSRRIDTDVFHGKAKELIYIIVSNVNFPEIKVRFAKGTELITRYPKGTIPFGHHDSFFA